MPFPRVIVLSGEQTKEYIPYAQRTFQSWFKSYLTQYGDLVKPAAVTHPNLSREILAHFVCF